MRMWMVDPTVMCRAHLLGEHVELHMLVGTIKKNVSLRGYVDGGLVDVRKVHQRHEQLVCEMSLRGYNHRSPLDEFSYTGPVGSVDPAVSEIELARRCPTCCEMQQKARKEEGGE
jgi:hypothetical protein